MIFYSVVGDLEMNKKCPYVQLGQKYHSAKKNLYPEWFQKAEYLPLNRKKEYGDRFSKGVVVLNQEEKEVSLGCGRLSNGMQRKF